MRKLLLSLSLVSVLSMPIAASALTNDEIYALIQTLTAQVHALQQQIAALQGNGGTNQPNTDTTRPTWCARYANLAPGSHGSDVVALQSAMGNSELSSPPTGYYGSLTRAAWNRRCTGTSPIIACPVTAFMCQPGQHTVYGRTSQCSQECVADTASDNRVTISSFTGPTTLQINQQGTWRVQAVDAANGSLSYSVSWGDEPTSVYALASANGSAAFVQQTTFTHAYAAAGTYTVSINVQNQQGQSATATITVQVGANSCSLVAFGIECIAGTHRQNQYDTNGCMIAPTCVPDTNSISVSVGASSAARGGTLPISWNASLGADSAVFIWLVNDAITNTGSATGKSIAPGQNYGLVVSGGASSGSVSWAVPPDRCDSNGICSMMMDNPSVWAVDPGTYHLEAKIVTPANACYGYCIQTNNKVLGSASSGMFVITQ